MAAISPDPAVTEMLARQESKCLEIIRGNPSASAFDLMLLCAQAGFQMGADHFQSSLVAELTIRGAKAA